MKIRGVVILKARGGDTNSGRVSYGGETGGIINDPDEDTINNGADVGD